LKKPTVLKSKDSINLVISMDEGSERDKTWGRGGLPTLPGLYHSTIQPSQRVVGSLKMNTTLEYSTRVVQEGDRRCKKSTLNDLAYLTPLRIPLMNPVEGSSEYIRVWRTMTVCYVTLSLTPSGLNLCQIVKTVHKT
jgi:hypothetical protein